MLGRFADPNHRGYSPKTSREVDFGAISRSAERVATLPDFLVARRRAVQVSTEGAEAQAQAGQAIGQAIGTAAEVVAKRQQEHEQHIAIQAEAELDLGFLEAQQGAEKEIAQTSDTTKHKGISERWMTDFKGRVDGREMPAWAKEKLAGKYAIRSQQLIGDADIGAVRIAKQQTDRSMLQRMEAAGIANDKSTYFAVNKQRTMGGYQTAEEEALNDAKWPKFEQEAKRHRDAAVYDQAQNSLIEVASSQGKDAAFKALDSIADLEPTSKERLRNTVQAVIQDRASENITGLVERIASGEIVDESQLNAAMGDNPHLSETIKQTMRSKLIGFQHEQNQMDVEKNGIANFVDLRSRVRDMEKPKNETEADKLYGATMMDVITKLPAELRGEVAGLLHQKFYSRPAKFEQRDEIRANVSKTLDVMFDPEKGAVKWKTRTKDALGKETVTEDLAKRQTAIDAQTAVETHMADWSKANPDKANNLIEVKKEFSRALPKGVASSVLQQAIERLNPPKPTAAAPAGLQARVEAHLSGSGLVGTAPPGGGAFGITKGTKAEWSKFLTSLAMKESSGNGATVGDEGKFGGHGSRGLFQLSPQDALNYKLRDTEFTYDELHDDDTNISTALKIMKSRLASGEDMKTALGAYWGPIARGWTPNND